MFDPWNSCNLLLRLQITRLFSCNLNSRLPLFQGSKAVYTVTKFLPVICNQQQCRNYELTVLIYSYCGSSFCVQAPLLWGSKFPFSLCSKIRSREKVLDIRLKSHISSPQEFVSLMLSLLSSRLFTPFYSLWRKENRKEN